MNEMEIRKLVSNLKDAGDVLISIPEKAGFNADVLALGYFQNIKDKIKKKEKPMQMILTCDQQAVCFTYCKTSEIESNTDYLEEFIKMAQQYGCVRDIVVTWY